MTLVVTATGPESIWLVADRRLTYKGRPPKDDGRKVMFLLMAHKEWMRELLKILKAYDHQRLSSQSVADYLAKPNSEVSAAVESVGPRCVVAWRHRKNGAHASNGGGHQFYTGTLRDRSSPALPTIGNGMDVRAIIEALMPHNTKAFERLKSGDSSVDLHKDRVNADLAHLPDKPDEILR